MLAITHGGAMKRALGCGLLSLFLTSSFLALAAAPPPVITGVSNNASGGATISSGSWVSIYGTDLSATTRSWQSSDFSGSALPTTIDGVSVQINGKRAAIAFVSPGQLNVQAPADSATGPVQVQVTTAAGSASFSTTLAAYSPAFFSFQNKYAAARHTDGVAVAPVGYIASLTSRAAVPGETLQVYATGFGPTAPAVPAGQLVTTPAPLADISQLKVTVGGQTATVQYAGLVAPGEYQLNLVVPQLVDGDQALTATIGGVTSQNGISIPVKNNVSGTISVSLSPDGRTIRCGTTLPLTVKVNNTTLQAVTWQVNGVTGGSATAGTVAGSVYTAPAVLPSPASVTITAISAADSTAKASITVSLQNPAPVVTSVTPNPLNPGSATLTISGTGFASGATVYFAGAALPTTFVSDTKLTATGTLTMPVGRMAAVKVANPNPGSATSAPVAIPVRPAAEKMAYADAVRYLQMTTFGPTPQSVADLQTQGLDAWLAAQFAKPASTWPDPYTTTEGVSRLQTAFFNIALSGDDQLRQRAAFALAQILVVSAAKDTLYEQMVSYQRLLGNLAFGSYRDLASAITLSPAMGDYLDMVNNEKANATAGTVANENYARELMQLFTVGLVQLDPLGNPIVVSGATAPEYDQSVVADFAKVTTGWTYGQTPGFGSLWKNMPYYFSPMIPFDNHHDTTQKTLNLPIPCTIPAGGTAVNDMNAALDCLLQQANVAPFVSYRLIQRLVMSDPSPAYVGRVASAFTQSKGNLQSVITAILTDPEAKVEGSGKLTEPILYATGLLRALNARVTAPDALTGQTTAMGQTALSPTTVFSYFMPSYTIPGSSPAAVAPEFQAMNAATAIARANFAYRVATNGISSGISVDLSNLQDLAANPADLVEALNQALFRGEMDSNVRGLLVTAASGSASAAARVRSALYAACAAPQVEVQR
jgi:uncharacterized protein (TIGR03437 family)